MVTIGAAVVLIGVVTLSLSLEGTNPDLLTAAPSAPPASPVPSGEPSGPPPSGEPGGPSASPSGGADAVALIEMAGCQACHGPDLSGGGNLPGPSLHGISDGPKSENLQQLGADHPDNWPNLWIDGTGPEVAGINRLGMPQFGAGILTTDEIATIVDYLRTLE